MDAKIIQYLPFFLIPFVLSLACTPVVRNIASKKGLVSYPRADRWHKNPTAMLGGVSIYTASLISAFILGVIDKHSTGLFIGATFLFIVGLLDDKFHFKPYTKLFSQIIAACIAVFFGATIGLPVNKLIIVPLTLLWIVGVTNSFNLLDNIDGLAGGIAAISSLMIFFSSLAFANNNILAAFSLIIAGAVLGFLPYNLNPAKIFMGDSGSMFLGYSLAVISISGATRHISNLFATMFIPVFILSVPIFDTLFVMIIRKLRGRKIFEGGTDHTSHRLVALGLSPRKTVFLLYIISIAFGLIALSYSRLDFFLISVIAFLAIVILLFFGVFLSENVNYNEELDYKRWQELNNNKTILNNILLYKRRIIEVLLDLAFICIAYYSAYFLRFQGPSLDSNLQMLEKSIIWLILIKISVFYLFGLYRGVWKYMSISDLITVFKAVTLASIFSMISLTLLFRFKDFSRTVFFLDWLILLFLVSGSRILFRVLGELFSRVRREGKNILIFGAGDAGEMVIREIKRNKSLNYNPVGFIDDNPSKLGYKIQGVPVLGARGSIGELVVAQNIEEVIIAIPSLDEEIFYDIVKICRESNVSYRRIKGILDKEEIIDDLGPNKNN